MRKSILLLAASAALLGACTEVPNGNKGVSLNYGKVDGVHDAGLVWYNPVTHDIVNVSVQQLKWESKTNTYTKDVQQADISFAVNYRLDPSAVKEVYKTVGDSWANTLMPQVVEQSIKNVFGRSEAVKDTINNRGAVQQAIYLDIREKLAKKHIIIEGFEIQDISFSKAFEQAVEQKQVAVENANAAKNKTVQIEEVARQKVITAKAEAEAMRIKSQALQGNPELTSYEAVLKWNGVLPQNMYGNAIPFINVK